MSSRHEGTVASWPPSGGSTAGGLAGGLGHAGPLVPGGPPVPTGPVDEAESPAGEAAPAPAADASEGDSGSSGLSPWVPLGIGLLVAGLAVSVPWLLGKRFAW